eukprot:g5816.t1
MAELLKTLLVLAAGSALPPGYDDVLYCPSGHCLLPKDVAQGLVGGRTAFVVCASGATCGSGVCHAPSVEAQPWGVRLGEAAKNKLESQGLVPASSCPAVQACPATYTYADPQNAWEAAPAKVCAGCVPGDERLKYTGGVTAPSGMIYAIPSGVSAVARFDPSTETMVSLQLPQVISRTHKNKFVGGVAAADGRIYAIPAQAEHILVIDPASDQLLAPLPVATGNNKWFGGVLAASGRIFGMPFSFDAILTIDVDGTGASAGTIARPGSGSGWYCGALGANGVVYGFPYHAKAVLRIDPAASES